LIVAVTIVLDAVLSTFVLDLGESVEESGPTASFEYTYSDKNNRVEVEMKTGDNLDGNLLRFGSAATEKTSFGSIVEWAGETVSAGDTATVEVESDETLLVVWQGNRSEQTVILSEYEVQKDPAATASIDSIDTSSTQNDGEVCMCIPCSSATPGEGMSMLKHTLITIQVRAIRSLSAKVEETVKSTWIRAVASRATKAR